MKHTTSVCVPLYNGAEEEFLPIYVENKVPHWWYRICMHDLCKQDKVAECNQLLTYHLTLPYGGCIKKNNKKPSQEPVSGLSIMGYRRKMAVQHGRNS